MTPNPHRGSDFADFLAEEDLMTPTMIPTKDLPTQLREFNRWRRGGEGCHPNPSKIGAMIDAAADRLEQLEREFAAERALADRLSNALVESMERLGVCAGHRKVLDQWKEARRDT
jgi:hypothetical protein